MQRGELSVVVCTYGRDGSLSATVQSLAHQTIPVQDYEVLIVDNTPGESGVPVAVSELRRAFFAQYPDHLRFVNCPIQGLSHARNAGLSEARGEIVCFIDDDAVACTDWLEQIVAAYEGRPQTAVVGGHIRLQPPEPRPQVLRDGLESYWSQFITPYAGYTEVDDWSEFPWGANWSARRKPLLEIGGFRTAYGRKGSDYGGGEELVAAAQLHSLGYKIAVNPQARVLHVVDRARFHRRHLWRTILASTLVAYRAQRDGYTPRRASVWSVAPALQNWRSSTGYPDVFLMRIAARLAVTLYSIRDSLQDQFHARPPS